MNRVNKTIAAFLVTAGMCYGMSAQTLTLEDCCRMAVENSTRMKNSILDRDIAAEVDKQAFASYFPQISAMGMTFRSDEPLMQTDLDLSAIGGILTGMGMDPVAMGIPSSYPIELIDEGTLGAISVMQPLFAGGQIVNGNKLSRLGLEVATIQMDMTNDEVISTASEYFWQLLALQEKLSSLESVDSMLQETMNVVRSSADAGVILDTDVRKVELQANNVKSSRIKLENGISTLRLVFAQFIGAETPDFEIQCDDFYEIPNPIDLYIAEDEALNSRNESVLLEKGVEAANLQKKMEIGKNLPTVAVGGAGYYMDMMDSENTNLIGMATVSVPISSWLGGSHSIRASKLKEMQAINDKEENLTLLKVDIQSKWNAVNEAFDQIEIARGSMEISRKELDHSKLQYEAGVMVLRDYLEAQMQYRQDNSNMIDAYVSYRNACRAYLMATGR